MARAINGASGGTVGIANAYIADVPWHRLSDEGNQKKKLMNLFDFVWLTLPLFCCLAFEDGCLTCFFDFVEATSYANSRGIGYWIANLIVE